MLSSDEFCELFNISKQQIDVTKHNGCKFITTINHKTFVDEKALIRRKEFKKKIWLQNHENFYELIENGITENKLSEILAKFSPNAYLTWTTFFSSRGLLFSLSGMDSSVLSNKISSMHWNFFRLSTFIIRRLKRLETNRQQKIYARLPNRDRYAQMNEINAKYNWEK